MILVTKPPRPRRLLRRAPALTAELLRLFDVDPASFPDACKFDKGVYGSSAVKRELKAAQYSKCCYCEGRFDAFDAGTVEHYRPKGTILSGNTRSRTAYYWLAYDWTNLYYACSICNESHKRDQFPLMNEARRATDHRHDAGRERPLVLDPGGLRDPRRHIAFVEETAVPKVDGRGRPSVFGRTTIEIAGLEREELRIARRLHLNLVRAQVTVIREFRGSRMRAHRALVRDARAALKDYARPEAAFWAATSDFLAGLRAAGRGI